MAESQHRIDDIKYGANGGPSWLVCTCAKRFAAATPEALEVKWLVHVPNRHMREYRAKKGIDA